MKNAKYPVPIYFNPDTRSFDFVPHPGFIPAEQIDTLPIAELHLFKSADQATAFRIGVKTAGDEDRHRTIVRDYPGISAVLLEFYDNCDLKTEIDVHDHRDRKYLSFV